MSFKQGSIFRIALSVTLLLIVVAIVFLRVTPSALVLTIDPASVQQNGEFGYVATFGKNGSKVASDTSADAFVSQGVLFENNRSIGPAHSLHADIITFGKGRYSHWDGQLRFSSSDNTDPRKNERVYTLQFPTSFPPWLDWVAVFAVGAIIWASGLGRAAAHLARRSLPSLIKVFGLAFRKSHKWAGFYPNSSEGPQSQNVPRHSVLLFFFTASPFLLIAIASACFVAPELNIDSAVLMAFDLPDTVFPHFPPGYPVFTRGIALIIEFLTTGSLTHNLSSPGPYSALDVASIVLIQHVLAVLGATYLAGKLTENLAIRVVAIALLYLNPITFLMSNSLITEALTSPVLYALIGKSLVTLRNPSPRFSDVMACMGLALIGAIVRFPFIITIAVLPIAIFARALLCTGTRPSARARQLINATAIVIVAVVTVAIPAGLITNFATTQAGAEPRSILGRAFIYNLLGTRTLDRPLDWVVTKDMGEMAPAIAARTDRETANDILSFAESQSKTWVTDQNRLTSEELDKCKDCTATMGYAAADRRMNKVAMTVITSFDSIYMKHVALRVRQYLALFTYEYAQAKPIDDFDGKFDNPTLNYDTIKKDFAIKNMREIYPFEESISYFLRMYGWIAAAAVSLACLVAQRNSTTLVAFAITVSATGYGIAMSALTVYIDRYGQSLDLLTLTSVFVAAIYVSNSFLRADLPGDKTQNASNPNKSAR
ncbi:MAG: hypothetical protein EON93_01475 [Burkholderiales bacterium]|nr:MAG: hypothetical protein EON93_01475 [Burkholderiales bacterium]